MRALSIARSEQGGSGGSLTPDDELLQANMSEDFVNQRPADVLVAQLPNDIVQEHAL
jgi:hypothetical protein